MKRRQLRNPPQLCTMASCPPHFLLSSATLFLLLLSSAAPPWAAASGVGGGTDAAAAAKETPFHVGVILDRNTGVGNLSWTCITMAVEDFYAAHPNYATRVTLHFRDSGGDAVGAAAAALDLLKNVQVQAIMGPQRSTQAKFLMELGKKSHVPIISFSARSPSLSSSSIEYFVQTAMNDSSQAKAITAIVHTFRWREVVLIYEDTEYGNGILPYLIDELQEINARVAHRSVLPLSATTDHILSELNKLKSMQTRVFVVHTTHKLGFQLFSLAKQAGMMDKGYVWITTYGLTDIPDIMGSRAVNVMQGVLGVKPYVRETQRLKEFKVRWRRRFSHENLDEPTVIGLWAYDTVWAIAKAAERVRVANFAYQNVSMNNSSTDFEHLGLSPIGRELLSFISNTTFDGLSGKFHLVSGQLESTMLEIVNVLNNGKRRIGFWTASQGVSRHLDFKADLRIIIWPGESTELPKGWEWPTSGKKLRIGVPMNPGFTEFVDMKPDVAGRRTVGSGFCIAVFDAVMKALPYPVQYEYVAYADAHGDSNGTYDELVYQVYLQNFDAVVGDVTIRANRSQYVDFTLPFIESGVTMVVPIKDNQHKKAWIFTEPFSADLWLASGCFFVFTGLVVWFLEHRVNEEFRGRLFDQLGTVFYFSFSTLVFAHRERLVNNLSRIVMIIWVFVVLILTSSYTASLSSMLTVQQLQPTVTQLNDLINSGDRVGYLNDSFLPGLLKNLGINQSKLIAYDSPDEYAHALDKGSSNGGVSAIVDEIPYIKVFLSKYCGKYTTVGPTYKIDGFGFVFPKGSPLVLDISRAILNVTEGEVFEKFEKALYGEHTCPSQSNSNDITSRSLRLDSFSRLFLFTSVASISALILFLIFFFYDNRHVFIGPLSSENSILQKLISLIRLYDQKDPSSHAPKKTAHKEGQLTRAEVLMDPPHVVTQSQSPSSISNHPYEDFDMDEGVETPRESDETPGQKISRQNPDPPSFAEMLNWRC